MPIDYNKEIKKYEKILSRSRTAYPAGVTPTKKDVSAQVKLEQLKKGQESEKTADLKEKWYGDSEPTEDKRGYFGNILHGLGAPLYATAGAVESVLGKGTEKGIANILENVKEEGTFGDILRSSGVPNTVSMPLGFALDVALDPLTWATMGTSAIVPRLGVGALKGGVKGLGLAAKSGALQKVETAGKLIPGLGKKAFKEGSESYLPSLYRKLSKSSVASRTAYDKVIGRSLENVLEESAKKVRLLDRVETGFASNSTGRLGNILFNYSPTNHYRALLKKGGRAVNSFDDSADDLNHLITNVDYLKDGKFSLANEIDDGLDALVKATPDELASRSTLENVYRLKGEKMIDKNFKKSIRSEVDEIAKKTKQSKEALHKTLDSGWKWYDEKILGKAVDSPVGRKVIEAHQVMIGIFKSIKIGGGLTSTGTASVFGNTGMTAAIGVKITNPSFWKSMKEAARVVTAKDMKALETFTTDKNLLKFLSEHPAPFQAVTSIDPAFVLGGRAAIDDAARKIVEKLSKGGSDLGKVSSEYREAMKAIDELENFAKPTFAGIKQAISEKKTLLKEGVSATEGLLQRGVESTNISTDILTGKYSEWIKGIKDKADKGSQFNKALHWTLIKPMKAFEKIDQTFKIGLALHLTKNGVSESELLLLAKRFGIGKNEVTQVAGRTLWKIKPEKAFEIANEAYMNYLAMPGVVKIARSMPIIGAPFFSFTYGASALTLKTGLYNPAYFNKVNFLLKELSGAKSPLEKEALADQYSSWLNKEGMVKLPFFKVPVYLNTENMFFHYTLNMFQPSERKYSTRLGGAMASIVDKLPVLKQPEGQLLMDYLVLPTIVGEAQGMFGQPLWPKDANLLEKTGYAARSGAEIFMPPAAGLLGPLVPEKVLPYAPLYHMRRSGFASRGKSPLGIPTKEPTVQQTMRAISSQFGLPVYPLNLTYAKSGKSNKKK